MNRNCRSEQIDFWWAGHAEEFSQHLNAFMVDAVATSKGARVRQNVVLFQF